MFLEHPAVLGADHPPDLREVGLQGIQHAAEVLAVPHPAVEFLEHLVRIGGGRHRLTGARVRHPGPRIGAILHAHAKLKGAEAGAGLGAALEEVADLLVDGDAARPARGNRFAPALDVARQELGAREQTAHPAHMAVAVPPDTIGDAAYRQEAVPVRREGLEDPLEPEVGPGAVRPKFRGNRPVGGKDDDQPLARARGRRKPEARQAVDQG